MTLGFHHCAAEIFVVLGRCRA